MCKERFAYLKDVIRQQREVLTTCRLKQAEGIYGRSAAGTVEQPGAPGQQLSRQGL